MDQPAADPHVAAQQAADQLATALEEVGFDVGQTFTDLHGSVGNGRPVVDLGQVTAATAAGLAIVLHQAAEYGVTLPAG